MLREENPANTDRFPKYERTYGADELENNFMAENARRGSLLKRWCDVQCRDRVRAAPFQVWQALYIVFEQKTYCDHFYIFDGTRAALDKAAPQRDAPRICWPGATVAEVRTVLRAMLDTPDEAGQTMPAYRFSIKPASGFPDGVFAVQKLAGERSRGERSLEYQGLRSPDKKIRADRKFKNKRNHPDYGGPKLRSVSKYGWESLADPEHVLSLPISPARVHRLLMDWIAARNLDWGIKCRRDKETGLTNVKRWK